MTDQEKHALKSMLGRSVEHVYSEMLYICVMNSRDNMDEAVRDFIARIAQIKETVMAVEKAINEMK